MDFREQNEPSGAAGHRKVKEVDELLTVLKTALEEILLAFGEYAAALGLPKKELRDAREAIGKGSEMVKL